MPLIMLRSIRTAGGAWFFSRVVVRGGALDACVSEEALAPTTLLEQEKNMPVLYGSSLILIGKPEFKAILVAM